MTHTLNRTAQRPENPRRKEFKHIEPENYPALLAAASEGRHGLRDVLLIRMILGHGFRVSEALWLKRSDLDLKRGLPMPNQYGRVSVIRSKGGYSNWQPLSAEERRSIREFLKANPRKDKDYIFQSERGGQLRRGAVNYILKRAAERAGLGHIFPHMLRHSFCYRLAAETGDVAIVQAAAGHANIANTARYMNVTDKRLAEKMAGVFD